MKNKKVLGLLIIIFSAIVLVSLSDRLNADVIPVYCDEYWDGEYLVDPGDPNALRIAVSNAQPGDRLNVFSGVCNGGVYVGPEKSNLTIWCYNGAGITWPDGNNFPLLIEAPRTVIRNCAISGGADSIAIQAGGTATLRGNIIQGASRFGINVARGSFATIIENTISNNARHGISVFENGIANIGFESRALNAPTIPNIIENNGENGIAVRYSASATIIGNTIRNNGKYGIEVNMLSFVNASLNDISGNTLSGIFVTGNSGVVLGSDTGTTIFDLPNTVSTPNGAYGIECSVNAYVDGRRGGLGKPRAVTNCVDGTIP